MEGAHEDSFTHEPLDQTRRQIRLISIIPEPSGEIQCKLKNAYLDDDTKPAYQALSYTWGSSTPLKRITINGRPFEVRLNLYAFFEAFRARLNNSQDSSAYKDETEWLWVDQICINQAAVGERNHQVKIMSDIYRQAAFVYVCLGPSDTDTEAAMRKMEDGFRRHRKELKVRQSSIKRKARDEISAQQDTPPIHVLRRFCENPYWQRLWIVQEVMLARYIEIICGETTLGWHMLKWFCSSTMSKLPPEVRKSIPSQLKWLAKHSNHAKEYTWPDLFTTFSKSQCFDPRDKVYGLQGLLQPDARMKIDYAQSVEAVFIQAIHMMCEYTAHKTTVLWCKTYNSTDPPVTLFLEHYSHFSAEERPRIGKYLTTAITEIGAGMKLSPLRIYEVWLRELGFRQTNLDTTKALELLADQKRLESIEVHFDDVDDFLMGALITGSLELVKKRERERDEAEMVSQEELERGRTVSKTEMCEKLEAIRKWLKECLERRQRFAT